MARVPMTNDPIRVVNRPLHRRLRLNTILLAIVGIEAIAMGLFRLLDSR